MEGGAPAGGRAKAVMAAMVEAVNVGRTRRGADFIRADFSDNTGQFSAACFEEGLVESFRSWAADGTCVLLTVELDSPSPDEPPRITVRGARPLDGVVNSQRMLLTLTVSNETALSELAACLVPGQPGFGEVQVRLEAGEFRPVLSLGNDYKLAGALADRLGEVDGISEVKLVPKSGPRLHRAA